MVFDNQTNEFVYDVSADSIAWIGAHRVEALKEPFEL